MQTFGRLWFDYLRKGSYIYFKDIRLVFSVISNYIARLLLFYVILSQSLNVIVQIIYLYGFGYIQRSCLIHRLNLCACAKCCVQSYQCVLWKYYNNICKGCNSINKIFFTIRLFAAILEKIYVYIFAIYHRLTRGE